MKTTTRKRLGDILVESGVITEEQLNYALMEKSPTEKLGDFLIKVNYLTEQQLIEVLEFQLGIPHVSLNQYTISPELLRLVPAELAKRAKLIPIQRLQNKLRIAMEDPMDYFAIEEVRMATGCQIETSIVAKDDLHRAITKYYDFQESMEAAIADFDMNEERAQQNISADNSPIVRLMNQIIANAVAQQASDIHFDPQETELNVRYRIDGKLRTERSIPKHMQSTIIARAKIMGGLNITESRVPQDGRIKLTVNMRTIDIRLATLPTVNGEKIVMRILDINNAPSDISKIGFNERNFALFRNMLTKPNGIILMTGPTGSGKSTTLYAALKELNDEDVNIITVEDPVEYQMTGINQIQVKEEIGLTFAAGLRSILRQDPDVIMIGEIRDFETAEIAIRASLTGHLVLSTLHTNSAVEAISRLKDMGIESFLIASSLVGVIAQRLVRKNCVNCIEIVVPSAIEMEIFRKNGLHVERVQRGKGCPSCNHTGYKGRITIHEMLPVNRDMKEFIVTNKSSQQIADYLQQQGIETLLQDGLQKVISGLTTIEEILDVAMMD